MKKYKPLTTAHWYIQKLERKADQFDDERHMSRDCRRISLENR